MGRLGKRALAAAAIGTTWFNLFWNFLLGVTTAFDTLGSQAYGAKDRAAVLSWAITALLAMTLVCIPVAAGMWWAEWFALVFFQQPPEIAQLMGTFCRWTLPGLLPFVWSVIIMKAMQTQNMFWAPAAITGMICAANVGINIGMIELAGFTGASAAISISRGLLFAVLLVYMCTCGRGCMSLLRPISSADALKAAPGSTFDANGLQQHQPAPSLEPPAVVEPLLRDAVQEVHSEVELQPAELFTKAKLSSVIASGLSLSRLGQFFKLGIPGGFMMIFDSGAFDITTALAGFLGTVEVDAHIALLTLVTFTYVSFPFAVSVASTIRVGNLLGAGRPMQARLSGYICIALGAGFMACAGAAVFIFRNRLGYIFVDNADVVALVATAAPIASFYMPIDGMFGCVQGVLRGMGRQMSLMIYNLVGFWFAGVVVGYTLCFKYKMGIPGLWWGITIGVFTATLFSMISLFMADWRKEAALAQAAAAESAAEEQLYKEHDGELADGNSGKLTAVLNGHDLEAPLIPEEARLTSEE
ncbi:hypothetical protein WJX72_006470 [[Myrmecia] bisecta]|uniref:Protein DETOXIFICATION n=1 Tax=[Myrmecia] bisecta TaxID=41462 RepID=A0AAW1R7M9_9CHLO